MGLHGRSIGGLPAAFVAALHSKRDATPQLAPPVGVSFLCMDRTFHALDSAAAHLVGVFAKWSVKAAAAAGAASSGRSEQDAFSRKHFFRQPQRLPSARQSLGEGHPQLRLEEGRSLAQEERERAAREQPHHPQGPQPAARASESLTLRRKSNFFPGSEERSPSSVAVVEAATAVSACMRRASCTEAFLSSACPKLLIYDPADAVVREGASLKSDVARRVSEVSAFGFRVLCKARRLLVPEAPGCTYVRTCGLTDDWCGGDAFSAGAVAADARRKARVLRKGSAFCPGPEPWSPLDGWRGEELRE